MTIDEFLDKLRQTKGPWRLTESDEIRCGRHCPITAVEGTVDGACDFFIAGRLLGLSVADRGAILVAADAARTVHAYDPELRQRLLVATVNREQPARAPAR